MKNFIYDPSLVLYLPLHMLDGASFMSKDAYGHSCAVTGALWTPQGGSFDGTDDYIGCGNPASLNITDKVTVEAWVNSAGYAGDNRTIAGKHYSSYQLAVLNTGEIIFQLGVGGVDKMARTGAGVAYIVDGEWYHLAGVYNKANVLLYVNNILFTGDAATGDIDTNAYAVEIGRRPGPNDDWWKGLIGEVRIYNRALSSLEIQHNYLASKWRYQ